MGYEMPKYISTDNLIASGRDFLAGVKYMCARGDGKRSVSMEKILNFLAETVPAEDVTPFVYCKNCGKREKRGTVSGASHAVTAVTMKPGSVRWV